MPASRQTEVGPGDADPLELPRGGQHPLDQRRVLVLDPAALDEGLARLGDAVGELVAKGLQLAQVEQSRARGDRGDAVGYLGVAEGLAEEAGELPLEAGDLLAQLLPRAALVDGDVEPAG